MRAAFRRPGFTDGEAEWLRRATATFTFTAGVGALGDKLISGTLARLRARVRPADYRQLDRVCGFHEATPTGTRLSPGPAARPDAIPYPGSAALLDAQQRGF